MRSSNALVLFHFETPLFMSGVFLYIPEKTVHNILRNTTIRSGDMIVVLLRSIILYVLVIFSVRLMGKRQLGELQPSELVITILVSNIATLPIEDIDIPVIVGITPILSLVCFEVIVSWISLKIPFVRRLVSGSPKIVVSEGNIDPEVLKELRFSADDLMMALRGKDVFDLNEIQFAIVETTGSISVMKKPENESPQRGELGISLRSEDPQQLIVSDGRIRVNTAESIGLNEKKIRDFADREGVAIEDVFLMTADSSGNYYIALKNGGKPIIRNEGE